MATFLILRTTASCSSVSQLCFRFLSRVVIREGSIERGPQLIQGCKRHSDKVGRFSETKSSIVTRKSLESFASCSVNSSFWVRTLFMGQKRSSLLMCRWSITMSVEQISRVAASQSYLQDRNKCWEFRRQWLKYISSGKVNKFTLEVSRRHMVPSTQSTPFPTSLLHFLAANKPNYGHK